MGGICCLTILCDSASSKGEKLALLAGQYQRSLSTNQVQNAFEVVGLGEQVYEMGLLNTITG
jgi:hypothetical protein